METDVYLFKKIATPSILPAKILLQSSCEDLGWDNEIPDANMVLWSMLIDEPISEA